MGAGWASETLSWRFLVKHAPPCHPRAYSQRPAPPHPNPSNSFCPAHKRIPVLPAASRQAPPRAPLYAGGPYPSSATRASCTRDA